MTKVGKWIMVFLCITMVFSSVSMAENSKKAKVSERSEEILVDLYQKYPDVWRIEAIKQDKNVFYYRVFEEKGSRNYFISKCIWDEKEASFTNQTLIWVWAKTYDQKIRSITVNDEKGKSLVAKVYLENFETLEEKIIFVDKPSKTEKYHFVLKP